MKQNLSKNSIADPRFHKGVKKIKDLARYPRYQAAFVFGSVAEGTSNIHSDLDAKVIVDEDNPCENINHPGIDDYKLDINFCSFKQLEEFTDKEAKRWNREPNLARAVIVFDKTGELTKLQKQVSKLKPPIYTKKDYQYVQFMLYHANDKVERVLTDDPATALYSMHANIGEVLRIHFQLHGKWWVSSKNVLANLDQWDEKLAGIVRKFVNTSNITEKHTFWSAVIDHITKPIGGRQPITENNCECTVCEGDLKALN